MARKQRSDKGVPRGPRTPSSNAPLAVTSPRVVTPDPAQATPIANGPTTGYRDGPNGTVETANFQDGVLPDGWLDSPAKCDNCDGMAHPDYVRVEP